MRVGAAPSPSSSRRRDARPEGARLRCGPCFSERAAGTETKIGSDGQLVLCWLRFSLLLAVYSSVEGRGIPCRQ